MPGKLSAALLRESVEVVARYLANPEYYLYERTAEGQSSAIEAAANETGIHRNTIRHRLLLASEHYQWHPKDFIPEPVEFDDDLPCPLETLRRHKIANTEYIQKKRGGWIRVIPVRNEPFAVAFIGDPHLDNKGCDLDQLERDLMLLKASNIRAVNMGDLLDNFHKTSKLAAKQAENRVSVSEGLSLARWFVQCGVKFDAHIIGNHDSWAGTEAGLLLSEWAYPSRFYDWMVRLIYTWEGGQYSVLCAHDFKGHSIHNPLHGLMRRAVEDGRDALLVAGHRHNSAEGGFENGFREKRYDFLRVRGYKAFDDYAHTKGFPQQEEGASAIAVINPETGRCKTFLHLEEGVHYLHAIRGARD